ncbi:MAG: family 78 glycoside hydrolase catalytic domain [Bacteroidales bacterium]|nr:family 78 glycoside hydrolase catalytic domain [Bacteroidales bacterium]
MLRKINLTISSFMLVAIAVAQPKPFGLTTDLIERTDVVYVNGYPSSLALEETAQAIEAVQYVRIASRHPNFGWIVDADGVDDVMQTAYEIKVEKCELIASDKTKGKFDTQHTTIWESGVVESPQSSAVGYGGGDLQPSTIYRWSVRTTDNKGRVSDWSEPKAFMTADRMSDYEVAIEPLTRTDEYPQSVSRTPHGHYFLDFGKASFGQLRLTLTAPRQGGEVTIHLGERVDNGLVNRQPAGTTRYRQIALSLQPGTHSYQLKMLPDYRNTHGDAVLMPESIGEVMPFRYVEVEGYEGNLQIRDVVRSTVHHPFNDMAASFHCSDETINAIWELCKYSMKATSFIGYHIDGDRERIPYELDALINQLAWYGTERTYSLSRRSAQYLLDHPTWPTEWILQSVLIAWYDYLYTGDARLLAAQYDLLKSHTLTTLRDENGLISTRTKVQTPEFLATIHRKEAIRDIVDWPQGKGSFGLDKDDPGESDSFEFTDYNTVVNAYHYYTLQCMQHIACALDDKAEAEHWGNEAKQMKKRFNSLLLNPKQKNYRDGVGTDHAALHSSMFAMAFGLVPQQYTAAVAAHIKSRGVACSISNAKFLLDALYDALEADYALSILSSKADRSWYSTLRAGSTITFEAWADKYKPNQDWNHAWGAAPADVIPHKLMGIEPLAPGWTEIRVRPQTSTLAHAEMTIPTIKGDVRLSTKLERNSYTMQLTLPANTKAQVYVPIVEGCKGSLTINGERVKARKDTSGKFYLLKHVGSGAKEIRVE